MSLTNWMEYLCSTYGCGEKAVIQLILRNFRVIYGCELCEERIRLRYRDAELIKLD